MKILNICDADPAGVGIRLTEAINQHTDHKARHIRMVPHKFGYPKDIETRDPEVIKKWVKWADIVNTHVSFRPLRVGGMRQLRPRNLMITYHGRNYMRGYWEMHIRAKKAGAKWSLCTTADLSRHGRAEWLPSAIPASEYMKIRCQNYPITGNPTICQTPSEPTRRCQSSARIKEILGDRQDLRLDIAMNVTHIEALQRKARANIFIDRFEQGLGVSGLEALAMGIPTIADALPEEEEWILRAVGYLPYYKAGLAQLPEAIDALWGSKSLYDEYADRGVEYIRKFHDYPVVAQRYIAICERVCRRPDVTS